MMALAVLVDDTFVLSVNESVKQRVKTLWEARFGKSSVPDGRTTEFGGLSIARPVPGVAEISCRRLCLDLADRLTPFPLPSHARCETPMAADALTLLRTPVSVANPLMGPAHTEAARALLGVGGWLAIQYRFDAHPSFVILPDTSTPSPASFGKPFSVGLTSSHAHGTTFSPTDSRKALAHESSRSMPTPPLATAPTASATTAS
jgi:hypothetical protein